MSRRMASSDGSDLAAPTEGAGIMPKYVVLCNWTDKGIAEASDTVQRAERVRTFIETLGGSMDTILWTLGEYDIIVVLDLPDDVSVAIAAAKASSTGHLRTKTTRAFTAEEVGAVISKLG